MLLKRKFVIISRSVDVLGCLGELHSLRVACAVLFLCAQLPAAPLAAGSARAIPPTMDVTYQSSGSSRNDVQDTKSLAEINIGTTPGRAISPTFMGIAHEWGDAQSVMGSSDTGINLIYRNLLGNLTAYGSGPIIVRVGGNSSDESREPTASTVRAFADLNKDTGAHFYLGVNLGAGNLQLALDQAKAFVSQMPPGSLDAIEIGNEPDSYVDKGMRGRGYQFEDYRNQFAEWRKAIFPLLPSNTRLLGPSWAFPESLSNIGLFLSDEHSYLFAVSQHFYVGNACGGHVNPSDTLLRARNTAGGAARIRDAVATVHGYHLPFRIDELNSIACGGQQGVSDTFGSALWSIDMMFEYANIGVDGVNWQSPNGAAYSPINFNIVKTQNSRAYSLKSVPPLYYGMLFFQAATGHGAHLLPVTVRTEANLKAWATIDTAGVIRLVVINKDASASGSVRVSLPGFNNVSLLRLTAPSVDSRTGVNFGGQTVDGGVDGKLTGSRQAEASRAVQGAFQINVPATSAVIAEFHP